MNKFMKKTVASVCALSMILGGISLLPADVLNNVNIGTVASAYVNQKYELKSTEDIQDDGLFWDADKKTLTLNNFNYTCTEDYLEFISNDTKGDITIKLIGDNVINTGDYSILCDVFDNSEGSIYVDGDNTATLTINGTFENSFFAETDIDISNVKNFL